MEHEISTNSSYAQRQVKQGKSKVIAVLLAVFLSSFGWLYTYKKNGRKFWLGSILSGLPILVATFFLVFYVSDAKLLPDQLLIFLAYALPISVWVWAIIDNLARRSEWYNGY
jgi:hypothetical protein